MTDAAGIIQALIARMPQRVPHERSTGMPHGWALWMKAESPRPVSTRAAEMVAALLRRPSAAPQREPELDRWRALLALFRQGWSPAPHDERPIRWTSGSGSLVLHLLFIVAMAWIAWLQAQLPPPPPEAGGGGGARVEVGFVGRGDPGTPQPDQGEQGAAAPAQPTPPTQSAAASAAQAAPADAAEDGALVEVAVPDPVRISSPVPVPLPAADIPLAVREVPEPAQVPAPAEQPAQVTEVERPTIDYVLPPATPRQLQARPLPEAQLRPREVSVVQAPPVQVPRPRAIDIPAPELLEPQLQQRPVDAPLPEVATPMAQVRVPQVEARVPGAPQAAVRQRELAMPSPAPAAAQAETVARPATPAAARPAASGQAPAPATAAAGPGRTAATAAPGTAPGAASPATTSARSGWESALAGDDWGQSSRGQERPGGAPGLYDGQGRIRLPGDRGAEGPGRGPGAGPAAGEGTAERGAPGGQNDTWTRDRIAQSGTWLKRPPYDYEPTRFDQYWLPNESILAEWVRKGIKSVAIPIPGTNGKTINCVVSLLQLGGGCGLGDPNLNEQPTVARPPPDIPFKPELQDDNGSVAP
ncbi:hypothetical protein [Pseudoxanthomonas koreensis]|uniref:hypothetical protein n=1 Tax=Pseudoxanthomonas koreensis TaxID=266061 RepID=UPI0035A5D37C